jgi:predicted TIM-barrel fold metal-dependent hydrolase
MRVRAFVIAMLFALCSSAVAYAQSPVDSSLAAFIATIRAVDNHTHVNSVSPADSESDALPLDGIPPAESPMRLRPESPTWIAAYRALYGYRFDDLSESHLKELRATMKRVAAEQGTRFPEWVLDRIGTEVMVGNRIAMGPGLAPPRFRWASYVDALMLPLSTVAERTTPDNRVLYPLEERLLHRYLADLHMKQVPSTLDKYLRTVLTPTLERQRKEGCIAVKFEAAYLRKLDFDDASAAAAHSVYARYASGGTPTHAEYKTLQDYLFREIAREAGRLGMAVHIHSYEGGGGFYRVAGGDPLLLEPAFNDPSLRGTHFVIVHGGGIFSGQAGAMLGKPNVYLDMSALTLVHTPGTLAVILRGWLTQWPNRVLFGTDAFATSPDAGWELTAWIGTTTGRQALAIALTGMMRDGEITRPRAEEIATMVMRGNASKLYGLDLKP